MNWEDPKVFEEFFDAQAIDKEDWASDDDFKAKYEQMWGAVCIAYPDIPKNHEPYDVGWLFENGYGISVIRYYNSQGCEEGRFEVGVIKSKEDSENDIESALLTYNTPITDDVIGNLTAEEVKEIGKKIMELEE